ncbi:MAG: hypothetical protein KDJ66_06380 [Nitratireductor sp.]|nr:hypothetical protein [Nitratireductor sp.]
MTGLVPFRPLGENSSPSQDGDVDLVVAQWRCHAIFYPDLTWQQFLDLLFRRERQYATRCQTLLKELANLQQLSHP